MLASLPPHLPSPPRGPPPLIVEDPTCPCIDGRRYFTSYLASTAEASVYHDQGAECQAGDILGSYLSTTGRGSQFCYPANYGSVGCQAYDAVLTGDHACAGDSPPSWCATPWCWVDKAACRRSEFDVFGSSIWDEDELFWSATSCALGTDGADVKDALDMALAYDTQSFIIPTVGAGEWLQVGIPGMYYPMHFKRDSSGAVVLGVRRDVPRTPYVPAEQISPRRRARQAPTPATLLPCELLSALTPPRRETGRGRRLLRRQRAVGGLDDRVFGRDPGDFSLRRLQLHVHVACFPPRLPELQVDGDRL